MMNQKPRGNLMNRPTKKMTLKLKRQLQKSRTQNNFVHKKLNKENNNKLKRLKLRGRNMFLNLWPLMKMMLLQNYSSQKIRSNNHNKNLFNKDLKNRIMKSILQERLQLQLQEVQQFLNFSNKESKLINQINE